MATPEQIFDDLAQRFKLEAPVTEQIVKLGITTLSEFRFYCQDDSELQASFFTPVESSLSNARLQKARLRQAWAAVSQAESAREDKGSAATVSLDEEDLLPASQLSISKRCFGADTVSSCRQITRLQTDGCRRPSVRSPSGPWM